MLEVVVTAKHVVFFPSRGYGHYQHSFCLHTEE